MKNHITEISIIVLENIQWRNITFSDETQKYNKIPINEINIIGFAKYSMKFSDIVKCQKLARKLFSPILTNYS